MGYSNAQILAAVLNRWMQPLAQQLVGSRLAGMPFVASLENKIKSTGWVRPSWSMAAELGPLMQPVTGAVLEPLLETYLSKMPDSSLPQLAHSIVDRGIDNGGLSFFDGNLTFERSDLEELKRLLDYNMPLPAAAARYEVKEVQP